MNFMKYIGLEVLPFIGLHRDNKKVVSKIGHAQGVLCNIENPESVETGTLEKRYENSLKIKDKLEDKAKSNIVAITVSITLIMGAYSLLTTINSKYSESSIIQWVLFLLYILAVVYMLAAGIISIHGLMHQNIIGTIPLGSYVSDEKLREAYDDSISMNENYNIIRNNTIYTAYQCTRNALICLFIVLLFAIVPFQQEKKTIATQSTDIMFSSSAMQYISINGNEDKVAHITLEAVDTGLLSNGKTVGFIDGIENIFVEAKMQDGTVQILYLSNYQEP